MVAAAKRAQQKRTQETVKPPSRSRATSVALSEVWADGHLRLEASSFGIELRQIRNLLRASGLPLSALAGPDGLCADPATPIRSKRVYVDRAHGVPFLSSSDIIELRPDPDHF